MTSRWDRELNDRLIELFLEEEFLWNSDLERAMRDEREAYERIARKLHIQPEEAKQKISNIKYAYRREKRMVLKMQGIATYTPGLHYFDLLDKHLGASFMKSNFGVVDKQKSLYKRNESEIKNKHLPTTKISPFTVEEKATQTVAISYEKMPKLISISKPNKTFQEIEFETFGKSLAKELKELPLEHALKLHLELQNIITDHRVSMIKKEEDFFHSIPGPSGLSNKTVNTIDVDAISSCDSARPEDFMLKTEKDIYHLTMNNVINNDFDEFDVNKDVSVKVMISDPCESDEDI